MKRTWFKGKVQLDCQSDSIEESLDNLGDHFKSVVTHMPGITDVEIIEQADDYVTLKTNEGLVKRNNIITTIDQGHVTLEYDEVYEAEKMQTTHAHFVESFTPNQEGISYQLQISDVYASGFLGGFYSKFGKKHTGQAILNAHVMSFAE